MVQVSAWERPEPRKCGQVLSELLGGGIDSGSDECTDERRLYGMSALLVRNGRD